jgi:hypothetical protein
MSKKQLILGFAVLATSTFVSPTVAEDKFDGFLCCNMRTDGKWISDINYEESGKRIIAFGTPVKVIGYGRYRVRVVIDGKVQHIGNDYSRDLKREVFARRYVVAQDPRPTVAAAPEKIRKAIESAKVTNGMTKRPGPDRRRLPRQQREPEPRRPGLALLAVELFAVHGVLRRFREGLPRRRRRGYAAQGLPGMRTGAETED